MHFRLFAYGTLMVGEIMTAVAGVTLDGVPARLDGYRRSLLRGEVYPGIRPDPRHRVDGVLYSGLSQYALQRLDLFEGEMYYRKAITLVLPDRQQARAETYVLHPEYYACLTEKIWSLESFLSSGRDRFVAEYAGMTKVRSSKHS